MQMKKSWTDLTDFHFSSYLHSCYFIIAHPLSDCSKDAIKTWDLWQKLTTALLLYPWWQLVFTNFMCPLIAYSTCMSTCCVLYRTRSFVSSFCNFGTVTTRLFNTNRWSAPPCATSQHQSINQSINFFTLSLSVWIPASSYRWNSTPV